MSTKSLDLTPRPSDEEGQISNLEINDPQPSHKKRTIAETLFLAYSSLGAVYGDIGTSPLYVLNSIEYPSANPTKEDIYGGVSIIFYLFVLIVLTKYALIVLTFGPNEGEGGQVAIYAKIAKCLKFGPKGVIIPGTPESSDTELLKRTETNASFMSSATNRKSWMKSPRMMNFMSHFTLFGCFLGCSLVFSDGLLTPTTSVLSAIAGIQVAQPGFDEVLAVSEVVIIFLFMIQVFGSHKISQLFAPVIFLWMCGLVICGIINITKHPAIFKALSPYYAIRLLKKVGVDAFSGAMLAITGTEAMFADLGHFGRGPTQIGIFTVFVCLMITYLGQGAFVIVQPDALADVFYLSIPGKAGSPQYWIMFVLATLSTVIASQALILGVFSILAQLINLDCFPRLKVTHVSSHYAGKVFIPAANILLLIGVCATTAGFKNGNNVTAAYGLGISLDFLVTSTLMIICMLYVYEFKWYIVLLFCLIFVPLEFCLIIANIKKVPHGAWFPLMMCAIFMMFLMFWRYCRDRTVHQQLSSRVRLGKLYPDWKAKQESNTVNLGPTADIYNDVDDGASIQLENIPNEDNVPLSADEAFRMVQTTYGITEKKLLQGIGIIYSDTPHQDLVSPNTVPLVYNKLIENFGAIPSIVVFCRLRVLSIPYVEPEEKILLGSMKIPGHFKCVLRFGFMEEVVINELLGNSLLEQILDVAGLRKVSAKEVPIVHIFEKNEIRARRYIGSEYATKNPLVLLGRYTRQFLIDKLFSPVNAIFQQNDEIVKLESEEEEQTHKLFVGGVTTI